MCFRCVYCVLYLWVIVLRVIPVAKDQSVPEYSGNSRDYLLTSNYYHKGNAAIILSSDTISRSVSTVMRSAGTPFSGKEFNAATLISNSE